MRISFRGRVLLVSACLMTGLTGWSQQSPKPVAPAAVSTDLSLTFAVERSQVVSNGGGFWLKGAGADAAVTFWKGLGVAASLTGDHASNVEEGVDVNKINFLAGPRYTWTVWKGDKDHRLTAFGQGLFGMAHGFDGLYPAAGGATTSASSLGIYGGGGLNYYLNKKWGLRLIEADYVRTSLPNALDDKQNDLRLAFGVTYHIEGTPAPAVTLACAAAPATIFPGDPVTVTATAGNLNPKLHAVYSFSGTGVTGTGATASVATGSLAAGSYTVKCDVKQGKAGKEGLKPWDAAEATSSFTVKAFEPPTVSCSANPGTLKPGETATVTATGVSPQNRPLTYGYTATAGTVAGTGATAAYSSIGAPTGSAGITCSTTDDKGQTATATTTVTILAPYVPPVPHTQALCSLSFAKDKLRPTRVDNEAKACLDEVALDLQKQSDAKVVLVGSSDAKEKLKTAKEAKFALKHKHAKVDDPAADRAVNAKEYLVTDKGIDAARVSVATDATDGQTAQDYLVPAGATFSADVTGTTAVDENAVKAQVRKPLPVRPAAHKKAVTMAATK